MAEDEKYADIEEETLPVIWAHELTQETLRARLKGPQLGHLSLDLYPLYLEVLAKQHAAAHGDTTFGIPTPFDYGNATARDYLIKELEARGFAVTARPFDRGSCQGLHISISWPESH